MSRRKNRKIWGAFSRHSGETGTKRFRSGIRMTQERMKQIPEETLMDRLLEKKQITPKMIEAVSKKLVKFYSAAETSDLIKSFAKKVLPHFDIPASYYPCNSYLANSP